MNTNNLALLIVGSRNFTNYCYLEMRINDYIKGKEHLLPVIISGGAKGADSLAERYAKENKLELKVFEAEWDKFGKSAGYKRNRIMHKFIANNFEHRVCLAFWDGKSKGTQHNFKLSKEFNTELLIY